jgi:glyoxylase-like metal-dependent hydrolase (beta-lactamase superfamily II)
MKHSELDIDIVVSSPFEENTLVARLPNQTDCLIVDPGFEPRKVLACLEVNNLQPAAILNTHGHSDHIAGNGAMKSRWADCPLIIGKHEAEKLTNPELNLSAGYGVSLTSPEANVLVVEGESINFAGIELHVLETPGHSSGHVVFVWKAAPPFVVFGGDVLFAGSVGRTDFYDGSFPDLEASIHHKLFALPDDTIVIPGHGPATTIGHEKQTNPFVGIPSGYRPEVE